MFPILLAVVLTLFCGAVGPVVWAQSTAPTGGAWLSFRQGGQSIAVLSVLWALGAVMSVGHVWWIGKRRKGREAKLPIADLLPYALAGVVAQSVALAKAQAIQASSNDSASELLGELFLTISTLGAFTGTTICLIFCSFSVSFGARALLRISNPPVAQVAVVTTGIVLLGLVFSLSIGVWWPGLHWNWFGLPLLSAASGMLGVTMGAFGRSASRTDTTPSKTMGDLLGSFSYTLFALIVACSAEYGFGRRIAIFAATAGGLDPESRLLLVEDGLAHSRFALLGMALVLPIVLASLANAPLSELSRSLNLRKAILESMGPMCVTALAVAQVVVPCYWGERVWTKSLRPLPRDVFVPEVPQATLTSRTPDLVLGRDTVWLGDQVIDQTANLNSARCEEIAGRLPQNLPMLAIDRRVPWRTITCIGSAITKRGSQFDSLVRHPGLPGNISSPYTLFAQGTGFVRLVVSAESIAPHVHVGPSSWDTLVIGRRLSLSGTIEQRSRTLSKLADTIALSANSETPASEVYAAASIRPTVLVLEPLSAPARVSCSSLKEMGMSGLGRTEMDCVEEERAPIDYRLLHKSQVQIADVKVRGKLSFELVKRVIQSRQARFLLCRTIELTSAPKGTETAEVRFVIGSSGNAQEPTVSKSDGLSDQVLRCIRESVFGVQFPEPESGIATVQLTLRFTRMP